MAYLVGEGGESNKPVDILHGCPGFNPVEDHREIIGQGALVSVDVLGAGRTLTALHQFDEFSSSPEASSKGPSTRTRINLIGHCAFSVSTSPNFRGEKAYNFYQGLIINNANEHRLPNDDGSLMVQRDFYTSGSWSSTAVTKWDAETGAATAHRVIAGDSELRTVLEMIAGVAGFSQAGVDEYTTKVMSRVSDMHTARRIQKLEQDTEAIRDWWPIRTLGKIGLGPRFIK